MNLKPSMIMLEILLILYVCYVITKITGPSVWIGWTPPHYKKTAYRRGEKPYGLPWMGGTMKKRKEKYFWDD